MPKHQEENKWKDIFYGLSAWWREAENMVLQAESFDRENTLLDLHAALTS